MRPKQATFPVLERQRARPMKRMRVVDAGHLPGGAKGIRFECRRCGHDTGWIPDEWTVSENRRGLPCPQCNAGQQAGKRRARWISGLSWRCISGLSRRSLS